MVDINKHIVLYTDGGCKPSRGKGGYGIHGYVFSTEVPKQGSGAKALPTAEGYIDGGSKDLAVTIDYYIDIWGSFGEDVTNNIAELTAMIKAMEYVKSIRDGLLTVKIMTDSEYVRKGLEEWVDKWQSQNWVKPDGTDVANKELWCQLLTLRDSLQEPNVNGDVLKLTISWVRGHSGDVGNTRADMLATRGVFMSQRGIVDEKSVTSSAKGYWKPTGTIDRLLSKTCWYFTTNASQRETSTGYTVYHLGNHGSEDKLLGKPMSDVSFSVVYTKHKDPVLEILREFNDQLQSSCYSESVVVANLSNIRQSDEYTSIEAHGTDVLGVDYKSNRAVIVASSFGRVLTSEKRPARLSYRALENLLALEYILELFIEKQSLVTITDVTESIYTLSKNKKGKDICALHESIGPNCKETKLTVNYDVGASNGDVEIKFLLGMDLPDRNTLNALVDKMPKVYMVTWREGDGAFRYASILELEDAVAIFGTIHSNLYVLI